MHKNGKKIMDLISKKAEAKKLGKTVDQKEDKTEKENL